MNIGDKMKAILIKAKVNEYASGMIGVPEAYQRGYSCGKNGANDYNSNYRIFSMPENTKAWEEGKNDAENNKPPKY